MLPGVLCLCQLLWFITHVLALMLLALFAAQVSRPDLNTLLLSSLDFQ